MKLRKFSNVYSIINIVFLTMFFSIFLSTVRLQVFEFVYFILSIYFSIYIILRLHFINLALIIILLFFNIRNFVKEKQKNIKSFIFYCILTLIFIILDILFILMVKMLSRQ